jgi:hypothetical protein
MAGEVVAAAPAPAPAEQPSSDSVAVFGLTQEAGGTQEDNPGEVVAGVALVSAEDVGLEGMK